MRQPSATRPAASSPLSRRQFLRIAAVTAATALGPEPVRDALATRSPALSSQVAGRSLEDELAALSDRITAVMEQAHVPGAAVGVLLDGQEAVAGFGVTNVDHPQAVDAATLFQIGSVTKTYTATALMRLVDQGRLELDTPIRHYLPDLQLSDPATAARLTLRHLLTHTSGLPANDMRAHGGGDDALARYAKSLGELPLLLPLGFAPSYSNIGFSVAGRVLEAVADRTYETAMRELLLDPLGLEHAGFFAEEAILKATSVGHGVLEEGARVQRPWSLPRTANPAGGIVLSLREQVRYARFWLGDVTTPDGDRVLSQEAMALMQSPQVRAPEDLVTLGVPWAMANLGPETLLAHDGTTLGQCARLWLMPARGFALCVLTNSVTGPAVLGAVGLWARERLLGLAVGAPAQRWSLALTDAELAGYAGVYENPGEARYTLTVQDGRLAMAAELTDPYLLTVQPPLPTPPPLQLAFETPERVYAAETPSARGGFLREPDGRIAGLFWEARFYRRLG